MRARAAEVATVVLAVAGLVVSLAALWPRLDEVPSGPVEPGPSAVAAPNDPADLRSEQRSRNRSHVGRPAIGTSDAALPRRTAPRMPGVARVMAPTGGIDSEVRPVGVAPDGQMALPDDPAVLGWYRHGPAPGEGLGSVVVAGHLDSSRFGLGPLVGLREVEVGDPVGVVRADGTRDDYTVVDVRRYDRQALPAELFARTGPERLRLVTCGGEYLPAEGGYQQNLVVTAVPR